MMIRKWTCIVLAAMLTAGICIVSPPSPVFANAEFDYEYVAPFSDGLAKVRKDNKVGYINKFGEEVIPLSSKYDDADSFSDGLARVSTGYWEDIDDVDYFMPEKYGYIDRSGEVVIPVSYDYLGEISDGLINAEKEGKWGYIDRSGHIVIPFVYDSAFSFSEGLAGVMKSSNNARYGLIREYGFIDKSGKEVIPLKYDNARGFSDGLAQVEKFGKIGYIDRSGNEVVPFIYDAYVNGSFSEGLVVAAKDGYRGGGHYENKWGYVDKTGEIAIPFIYDTYGAQQFSEGLAAVRKDQKSGYIDKSGKVAVPFIYDPYGSEEFSEGRALVRRSEKIGFVDKNGREVVPLIYDDALSFSEGLALVAKGYYPNRKYGFVDRNGVEVIPVVYDNAQSFSEGIAWVLQNGKWKMIDASGNAVGPIHIYDETNLSEAVLLDYAALGRITDAAGAVRRVTETVESLTPEQRQLMKVVDQVALYAEEALTRSSETTAADSDIIRISRDTIVAAAAEVQSAKMSVEQLFADEGVAVGRELQTVVAVRAPAADTVRVAVDASVSGTEADRIRIDADGFGLTLAIDAVKAELSDGEAALEITLETVNGGGTTASAGQATGWKPALVQIAAAAESRTVKVTFNKPTLSNTVKLSLPPAAGETTYQTVTRGDGTAVSSKYNPATGRMEAWITSGGTYTVVENRKDFSDIQSKPREMQEAIRYLASKGIIGGTSATTFSPDSSISRAEVAALVVRALGKLDPNANGGFADVTRSHWYYGVAGSAKRHGIVGGYEDNTFRGTIPIPKVQIVAIASRTLTSEMKYKWPQDVAAYLTYTDKGAIADWAAGEVAMATRENLVLRRADGSFMPNETMTRGDAAIILKRMFDKIW